MLEYDEKRTCKDRLYHSYFQRGYAQGFYEGVVISLRIIYQKEEKESGSEQADARFLKASAGYPFAEEFLHFIRKYPGLSDKAFTDRLAAETEYFPGDI